MNGSPQQQQSGISGKNEVNIKLEKQGTDDEEKEANELAEEFSDLCDKVPMTDLLVLIKKLNEKPELAQMLKNMAANS